MFQEIVLQLWKSYPSFKGQSQVSTWMYRVALNTILSRIRKEKARPKQEVFSPRLHQIPNLEDAPVSEVTQALQDAIRHLSAVEKAIILLYLEEHSYQEIATLLALSKTNVSTRINRIKGKLEKLLKPQLPWI